MPIPSEGVANTQSSRARAQRVRFLTVSGPSNNVGGGPQAGHTSHSKTPEAGGCPQVGHGSHCKKPASHPEEERILADCNLGRPMHLVKLAHHNASIGIMGARHVVPLLGSSPGTLQMPGLGHRGASRLAADMALVLPGWAAEQYVGMGALGWQHVWPASAAAADPANMVPCLPRPRQSHDDA